MAMPFGLGAYQQLKRLPSDQQQALWYEQFQPLQQTPDAKEGMVTFLKNGNQTGNVSYKARGRITE